MSLMKEIICGLDEAGRGPLAGPVTAGAVILPPDFPFEILNDSKKLSEKKRIAAEKIIKETALSAVSFISPQEIDEINILQASLKAMTNAFNEVYEQLPLWLKKFGLNLNEISIKIIADGNKIPPIVTACAANITVESLVKADSKVYEVMAASIMAKVSRDNYMYEMDKLYPEYGYASHKGYPTKAHVEICRKIGPSPIQRLSFKY